MGTAAGSPPARGGGKIRMPARSPPAASAVPWSTALSRTRTLERVPVGIRCKGSGKLARVGTDGWGTPGSGARGSSGAEIRPPAPRDDTGGSKMGIEPRTGVPFGGRGGRGGREPMGGRGGDELIGGSAGNDETVGKTTSGGAESPPVAPPKRTELRAARGSSRFRGRPRARFGALPAAGAKRGELHVRVRGGMGWAAAGCYWYRGTNSSAATAGRGRSAC